MSEYKTLILDVSKWNTKTKLEDFKQKGFTGVIIRAGYGKEHIDPKANDWYNNALDVGMDIGAYWFSYAKSIADAKMEAQHLLNWAKDKEITLPLVYDYEQDSTLGKKVDAKMVNCYGKMFCQTIEAANYYTMFYSNHDYYINVWDTDMKAKYDCWYARYKDIKVIKADVPNVHLAQYATSYSFGAKVISQDVNYDFVGLANIIKRKGLTGR